MATKTLRVGVISLGWMGRLHSRSYKRLAEVAPELDVTIELAVAADPNEHAREYATACLGFAKAVADYRDVLADPTIDVVSICSPNFLHHEIAMAAIAAGKPFWIEKPMGISAAQSADIALAAQEAGLVSCVGFNYRFAPAIQYARKLIRDGVLGTITNVRCWFIADYASRPDGPLTWRYDVDRAGSGVIADLMSHAADLVQWVTDRIERVSALDGTFIPTRPIPLKEGVGHSGWEISDERGQVGNPDYVAVLARLANGALATIESSRVSVGPRAEYVVEVYGTEGSLRWNFEHLNDLEVCIGRDNMNQGYTRVMAGSSFPDFARFQPGPGNSMGFDDFKAIEASRFIASILTGEQLSPSAGDGWAAAEVADAVVESARTGQWVEVPDVTATTTYNG